MFLRIGTINIKSRLFFASSALIRNRLNESANLTHSSLFGKLIFSGPWRGLKLDLPSYNWRRSVVEIVCLRLPILKYQTRHTPNAYITPR